MEALFAFVPFRCVSCFPRGLPSRCAPSFVPANSTVLRTKYHLAGLPSWAVGCFGDQEQDTTASGRSRHGSASREARSGKGGGRVWECGLGSTGMQNDAPGDPAPGFVSRFCVSLTRGTPRTGDMSANGAWAGRESRTKGGATEERRVSRPCLLSRAGGGGDRARDGFYE